MVNPYKFKLFYKFKVLNFCLLLEIKYTIMDSIWKCIDGSIKPEQIVSSFAEQKV